MSRLGIFVYNVNIKYHILLCTVDYTKMQRHYERMNITTTISRIGIACVLKRNKIYDVILFSQDDPKQTLVISIKGC